MNRFILMLVLAALTTAQNPPATRVAGHALGESFSEWLSLNHLDLADICAKHSKNSNKGACKNLSTIRDTGRGTFYLGFGRDGRAFGWWFYQGRLAGVNFSQSLPDTALEVRQLTEVYGAPTETKTVQYQNAFGAKWDCLDVRWNMPDGAVVRAAEVIENLPAPTRVLKVTITSRAGIEADSPAPQPNPYK